MVSLVLRYVKDVLCFYRQGEANNLLSTWVKEMQNFVRWSPLQTQQVPGRNRLYIIILTMPQNRLSECCQDGLLPQAYNDHPISLKPIRKVTAAGCASFEARLGSLRCYFQWVAEGLPTEAAFSAHFAAPASAAGTAELWLTEE